MKIKGSKNNRYGRADKAAAWTVLAKLYLNAKVYNGTNRNADVITYADKVISAGYSLKKQTIKVPDPNNLGQTIDKDISYESLFLADNHVNNPEVILPEPLRIEVAARQREFFAQDLQSSGKVQIARFDKYCTGVRSRYYVHYAATRVVRDGDSGLNAVQ